MLMFSIPFFLIINSVHSLIRFGDVSSTANGARKLVHKFDVKNYARSKDIYLPLNRPKTKMGEKIEFHLFDGQVVKGVVNDIVHRGALTATWSGSLQFMNTSKVIDSSNDWFTLSCHMDACVAHLVLESTSQNYIIHPTIGAELTPSGSGQYSLSEIGKPLPSGTSREKSHLSKQEVSYSHNSLRSQNELKTSVGADTDLIIDIGVIYTPQALATFGNSQAAMASQIYLATDEANRILANSQVSLRIRVVFALLTADPSFVEPGIAGSCTGDNFGTLLGWLRNPKDGYLDEAQVYRDQYGADFVLLINACGAYGGLGYVNSGYAPDYAYANYNVGYVYGTVWMHEMGHIMGCHHDRFSTNAGTSQYIAYGNCWEDTSKTDCTCYSSVMVYNCRTVPNNCTSCSGRPYLSNYKVMNAGSPTGLPLASCGVYIDNNRLNPISYRNSKQTGGMIFSVSPNSVMRSSCITVNITGWMLGFGGTITSVTLAGVSAPIISQTLHSVIVQSPNVTSSTNQAGDVVITTTNGRITKRTSIFSFLSAKTTIKSDFQTQTLDSSVWSSTGAVSWSTGFIYNKYAIKKGSGVADTDLAQLTTTKLMKATLKNPCYDTIKGVSFSYWAYSAYSFCYNGFYLYTMSASGVWTKKWTGTTGSTSATSTPWISVNLDSSVIPADTRQIRFDVLTSGNTYCRWWTPVDISDINLNVETICTGNTCLSGSQVLPPPPAPSSTPTMIPSVAPTWSPSRPTIMPTIPPMTLILDLNTLYTFDGISQYQLVNSLSSSLSTTFTVCAWIQANTQGSAYLFSLGRSPSNFYNEFILSLDKNGRLSYFDFYYNYGLSGSANTVITTGKRTHIAFVKNGLTGRFYVNGILDGTLQGSLTGTYATTNFVIGKDYRDNASFFKGSIDSTKVFSSALISSQLIAIMQSQGNPSIAPSTVPSTMPSYFPSKSPSKNPSLFPTAAPSTAPTSIPSKVFTSNPTLFPTAVPSTTPTSIPSKIITRNPSLLPTSLPSTKNPSAVPITKPSIKPTNTPTSLPTKMPNTIPSSKPSRKPTLKPSITPSKNPSVKPTRRPTIKPSLFPTKIPTVNPTTNPTGSITLKPSSAPI